MSQPAVDSETEVLGQAEPYSCGNERCFCCGTAHRCEPTSYPATLGETWTCPECGEQYLAFSPHETYPADHLILKHLPRDAIGWRLLS